MIQLSHARCWNVKTSKRLNGRYNNRIRTTMQLCWNERTLHHLRKNEIQVLASSYERSKTSTEIIFILLRSFNNTTTNIFLEILKHWTNLKRLWTVFFILQRKHKNYQITFLAFSSISFKLKFIIQIIWYRRQITDFYAFTGCILNYKIVQNVWNKKKKIHKMSKSWHFLWNLTREKILFLE